MDEVDHRPYAESGSWEVHEQVDHRLAWAMIGHLATAVGLNDRNSSRVQQVLRTARLALREHGLVLGKPKFISHQGATLGMNALVRKLAHGLEDRTVVGTAKLTHKW